MRYTGINCTVLIQGYLQKRRKKKLVLFFCLPSFYLRLKMQCFFCIRNTMCCGWVREQMNCDTTWHLYGKSSAAIIALVSWWWNLGFFYFIFFCLHKYNFIHSEDVTPAIRKFHVTSCDTSKRWFVGNNNLLVCLDNSVWKSQERNP